MSKNIIQCVLESGNKRLVAWLDASKVKEGYRVTLKDYPQPDLWWTVIKATEPIPTELVKKAHDSKAIWEKDYHDTVERLRAFDKK